MLFPFAYFEKRVLLFKNQELSTFLRLVKSEYLLSISQLHRLIQLKQLAEQTVLYQSPRVLFGARYLAFRWEERGGYSWVKISNRASLPLPIWILISGLKKYFSQ